MHITMKLSDEDGLISTREFEGHGQYFKLDQVIEIKGPLWRRKRVVLTVQTSPDDQP